MLSPCVPALADSASKDFEVKFTPSDSNNFTTVSLNRTVTVNSTEEPKEEDSDSSSPSSGNNGCETSLGALSLAAVLGLGVLTRKK